MPALLGERLSGERLAGERGGVRRGEAIGALRAALLAASRAKLATSASPYSVQMLSGWNWGREAGGGTW